MMKNTELKDGYRYEDLEEGVIFNHYSFCVLVKHIMVKYGHLTQDIAEKKLNNSFLVEVPSSKDYVEFLGHELEFHWAMIATYGEMYWTDGSVYKGEWNKGIQHGKGIMTFPDGRVKDGYFENNVFKGNV